MKKYRIWWDNGFGRTTEDVEAEDQQEAIDIARMAAKEEAESNMDYGADECIGGCDEEEDSE